MVDLKAGKVGDASSEGLDARWAEAGRKAAHQEWISARTDFSFLASMGLGVSEAGVRLLRVCMHCLCVLSSHNSNHFLGGLCGVPLVFGACIGVCVVYTLHPQAHFG